VARVAAIFELAADGEGVRMTEIAADLGAPTSSIRSLLRGLVATGDLEERAGRYKIGLDLAVVVRRAGLDLPDRAIRDELSRRSAATSETAIYGVRSGRSVTSALRLGNAIESYGGRLVDGLIPRRSAPRPPAQREQGVVQ